MELKKSLSAFSDRNLLEIILLNQVSFERRLERIETHIEKSYGRNNAEYTTAPSKKDGRQDGYTLAKNFEELIMQGREAKITINQYLNRNDSEIGW